MGSQAADSLHGQRPRVRAKRPARAPRRATTEPPRIPDGGLRPRVATNKTHSARHRHASWQPQLRGQAGGQPQAVQSWGFRREPHHHSARRWHVALDARSVCSPKGPLSPRCTLGRIRHQGCARASNTATHQGAAGALDSRPHIQGPPARAHPPSTQTVRSRSDRTRTLSHTHTRSRCLLAALRV